MRKLVMDWALHPVVASLLAAAYNTTYRGRRAYDVFQSCSDLYHMLLICSIIVLPGSRRAWDW